MGSPALVLASHAAALAVWALFVRWEVKQNARLIKENGSADNLKDGFHGRRTWIRLWWGLGCVVGGSLAAGWAGCILSAGALIFLLGGYFVRTFNPQLNVAMGLDYKARFYLSPSPTAASFPDRYLWREIRQRLPNATQEQANFFNQVYLNIALTLSLVGYAVLVALDLLKII